MTTHPSRLAVLASLGLAGLVVTGLAAQRPSTAPVIDSRLYAGLVWRNVGPFRGGRVSAISGAIGQPGVFYAGYPGAASGRPPAPAPLGSRSSTRSVTCRRWALNVVARRDGIVVQPMPGGDDFGWNDANEEPDRQAAEAGVLLLEELFDRMAAMRR